MVESKKLLLGSIMDVLYGSCLLSSTAACILEAGRSRGSRLSFYSSDMMRFQYLIEASWIIVLEGQYGLPVRAVVLDGGDDGELGRRGGEAYERNEINLRLQHRYLVLE